jgi:hypothetical protein
MREMIPGRVPPGPIKDYFGGVVQGFFVESRLLLSDNVLWKNQTTSDGILEQLPVLGHARNVPGGMLPGLDTDGPAGKRRGQAFFTLPVYSLP